MYPARRNTEIAPVAALTASLGPVCVSLSATLLVTTATATSTMALRSAEVCDPAALTREERAVLAFYTRPECEDAAHGDLYHVRRARQTGHGRG